MSTIPSGTVPASDIEEFPRPGNVRISDRAKVPVRYLISRRTRSCVRKKLVGDSQSPRIPLWNAFGSLRQGKSFAPENQVGVGRRKSRFKVIDRADLPVGIPFRLYEFFGFRRAASRLVRNPLLQPAPAPRRDAGVSADENSSDRHLPAHGCHRESRVLIRYCFHRYHYFFYRISRRRRNTTRICLTGDTARIIRHQT